MQSERYAAEDGTGAVRCRFLSRKFLAVMASVTAILAAALAGEVGWQDATNQVMAIVLAYLGVEGAGDVAARWRGRAG